MNTDAPEFSALMIILRSTGPVISTRRSCRSAGIAPTFQSPLRTAAVSARKSGRAPALKRACVARRRASSSSMRGRKRRVRSSTNATRRRGQDAVGAFDGLDAASYAVIPDGESGRMRAYDTLATFWYSRALRLTCRRDCPDRDRRRCVPSHPFRTDRSASDARRCAPSISTRATPATRWWTRASASRRTSPPARAWRSGSAR